MNEIEERTFPCKVHNSNGTKDFFNLSSTNFFLRSPNVIQIFLIKHRHNPKFYRTLTIKKQNSTIDIIKIACVLTLKSAVHLTKSAGCPE